MRFFAFWPITLSLLAVATALPVRSDEPYSPPPRDAGEGPYQRLILRGATVVDGTGAPPFGPADLVIEDGRIAAIVRLGHPDAPIDPARRPAAAEGDRELDLAGSYVLPGFVDLFAYLGDVPTEYTMKLLLGHGVTTVREVLCGAGLERCVELAARAERGEIASPRVVPYFSFGRGRPEATRDPAEARKWVAEQAAAGAAGIRFRGGRVDVVRAAIDAAREHGLGTSFHHSPSYAPGVDALDTAGWGLTLLEHGYGIPEALFTDRTVPDYPAGYNYSEERGRFAAFGRLWQQAAPPGSERWRAVIDELAGHGLTLVPTLSLYEANRDLMRAYRAEWHERYALPETWRGFRPDRRRHAAHFYDWTTDDEVAWKAAYKLWMAFLDDYKDRGGPVAVGTDSGFMYSLHGFAYVRELELLREAGFHALEVIRAATLTGAEVLGLADRIGSVEVGKEADLVVVGENPLRNLKVLYGTGVPRLDENGELVRAGGIETVVRGKIVYDARALLADVRRMVETARGGDELDMLGLDDR